MPTLLFFLALKVASPPVHLTLEGVLGDRVQLGPPRQARTTILIFMSRRAKDESAAFARSLDETLLNAPVESVGIVDVRRYGGVLRGLATSYLRKAARDGLDNRRDRRTARGIDASPEMVGRWHLVGDFDGSLFGVFGVPPEPDRPVAFVLAPSGTLRGPFRDPSSLVASLPAP